MISDNTMRFNVSDSAWLDQLVIRHEGDESRLLQVLEEVQEHFGFISPQVISRLANQLSIPRARIESVASFYSFLHLEACGEYRLLFSDNITDRMLGSRGLMEQMCELLAVRPGRLSEDGLVSIGTTSCTGMCDQGPAMLVNGQAITRLSHHRVREVAHLIRNRSPLPDWPQGFFKVESNIQRSGLLLNNTLEPGAVLRSSYPRGAQSIVQCIKDSGLRGRGGAGFSAGLKWEWCHDAKGSEHYVVCNGDEGEPGTFKDRVLLTDQADLVFEGMTLCALAVGAERGFLYLRGEYHYLLESLQCVLQRRRENKLLGKDILGQPGFNFDIDIHLGAGAYICGEESALIESLEGKRGVPRGRPPFPVTHGYKQQPTMLGNVETFCQAVLALHMSSEKYRTIGTEKSTGSKIISVSGDCSHPGIYEYPFGVSVAKILEECGAINSLAVQVGGPSGVCVPKSEFDRCLGFEDLPTAGAFMVFDDSRDMFDVALNFVHFFAHESCGFCTPCRVGTSMLKQSMDKIAMGHGTQYDLKEIEALELVLQAASHCGLGRTACNPVVDTLKHFRSAYENKLKSLRFSPAFDLDGALACARRMTGRDDAGAHLRENE